MKADRRIVAGKAEVRKVDDVTQIVGHAAVFNVEAVIGDNFRERIMPGAFANVIASSPDVRSLFNHDPNFILGRTIAGTLRLSEDATGLRYEADLNPEDRTALDIAAKVTRGDVTGSSFAFRVKRDEWTRATRAGELPLRTIHEYEELLDVGPVTFPAYNEATAEARDQAAALLVEPPAEIRQSLTPDEGEEAAELVQYQTAASALAQATAALATAAELVNGLIADETESPTETADAEAAEEEVETARLRSLLVLCAQVCGAVSGVSALAQAMLSDEYDPILYARSADADGDRGRRLRLAQATR
jgi:HK97 family phage prohead protease